MSAPPGASPPDRELFRRASDLFAEALDQPEPGREGFVEARCAGDDRLAREVLALLAAHGRDGILDGAFGPPAEDPDLEARVAEALADRYRIVGRLGEGGTAVVFLAWEKKHDRRVVLKVMRPDAQVLFGQDRFLEEVRLASALSHPHILPFIDSGRADGLLYYVMPHVEGESLYERLQREAPLAPGSAIPLLRDVAEALAYAHEEGVVHRDLKPGNVLCAGAHAYLMDFGVAKALRSAPDGAPRTRVGFVPGTPRYMAPEQIEARPDVGPPADVFAWGQLAHECLTGSVRASPWTTGNEVAERLRNTHRELPRGITRLVALALSPEPEARPAAREIVSELDRLTGAAETGGVRAGGGPRRNAGWLLGVAAAGMVLVFGMTRGAGAPGPAAAAGVPGPVAVAEFRNETGDPSLDFVGRLAGDWLTQGLQDLDVAQVVPWPSALAASGEALAAGAVDPTPHLRDATGARTVVAGAFYRVGDELRFQAEVVDADRQRVRLALESVRVPADRPEDGIAELRDRIMGGLAVLGGARAGTFPGLANRAPTFEAYRLFDRAMSHYLAQEYTQATPIFLEAYARDTTFTMSLLYGATTAWNHGDRELTDSLVRVVAARRARLSEYDDLRWQFLDAMLRADGQEILRVLRRSEALVPGSQAGYNLARQAIMMNRPAEALRSLERLDPDDDPMRGWAQYWTQVTHANHLLGRHAHEARAAREMIRRHPERTLGPVLEARALAAGVDLEALEVSLERSAVRPPRTYWSHGAALVVAGEELLAHAAAETAEPYLLRALEWLDRQIEADPDYAAHGYWKGSALYDLGRWEEALTTFAALLETNPTSTAYLGMAAVAAARLGEREATERYLRSSSWGYEVGDRLVYTARAEAILGDSDRALDALAEALDHGSSGFPWMHASGHHDFAVLRQDPRIGRLLEPVTD
jgi:tetratricopeptide (TPR) repeat protein/TolB-like protein